MIGPFTSINGVNVVPVADDRSLVSITALRPDGKEYVIDLALSQADLNHLRKRLDLNLGGRLIVVANMLVGLEKTVRQHHANHKLVGNHRPAFENCHFSGCHTMHEQIVNLRAMIAGIQQERGL